MAKEALDSNPRSVLFYALWQASKELAWHFDDKQDIPEDEAERIDDIVVPPLSAMIRLGAFSIETPEAIASFGSVRSPDVYFLGLNSLD